jgi:hypothetical protein
MVVQAWRQDAVVQVNADSKADDQVSSTSSSSSVCELPSADDVDADDEDDEEDACQRRRLETYGFGVSEVPTFKEGNLSKVSWEPPFLWTKVKAFRPGRLLLIQRGCGLCCSVWSNCHRVEPTSSVFVEQACLQLRASCSPGC